MSLQSWLTFLSVLVRTLLTPSSMRLSSKGDMNWLVWLRCGWTQGLTPVSSGPSLSFMHPPPCLHSLAGCPHEAGRKTTGSSGCVLQPHKHRGKRALPTSPLRKTRAGPQQLPEKRGTEHGPGWLQWVFSWHQNHVAGVGGRKCPRSGVHHPGLVKYNIANFSVFPTRLLNL